MENKTFKAIEYVETPLPQKPRLVPWVTWVDLGDERLQFRGADFSFTLRSSLFIEVFETIRPYLDGRKTVDEVCSSCPEDIHPTTVSFLLKMLRANGLLQEGVIPPALDPHVVAERDGELNFLSHFVADSTGVLSLLSQARLGVVGSGRLKSLILASVREAGMHRLVDLGEPRAGKDGGAWKEIQATLKEIDFLIACQDSPADAFWLAVNQACLDTGTRWIHAAIEGTTALLGPTFIPHQTACYTCYDRRLNSNIPDLDHYSAYKNQMTAGSSINAEGFWSPLWSLLASHVAMEVARIISGFSAPTTLNRFYRVEQMSPVAVGHNVLRVPRCPSCHSRDPLRAAWHK